MLDCGATLPFVLPVILACPLVITEPHLDPSANQQAIVMTLEGSNTNRMYQWQVSTNLTLWTDCGPEFEGTGEDTVFAFQVKEPMEFYRCKVTTF